jgi:hypothetical protein
VMRCSKSHTNKLPSFFDAFLIILQKEHKYIWLIWQNKFTSHSKKIDFELENLSIVLFWLK